MNVLQGQFGLKGGWVVGRLRLRGGGQSWRGKAEGVGLCEGCEKGEDGKEGKEGGGEEAHFGDGLTWRWRWRCCVCVYVRF